MNPSPEAVSNWMRSQAAHTFIIEKKEQQDTDLIRIQVEQVEAGHQGNLDPDDYVAEHAIMIHGEGCQIGEAEAALPHSVYEIPLIGECEFQAGEDELLITTERAKYVIRPEAIQ
jgi:hypothetical protein